MSNQVPYEGARFYKCALQVNSYRYCEYRGEIAIDEEVYNKEILQRCKENNIRVVGLADHGSIEDKKGIIYAAHCTDDKGVLKAL